jgi:DNA-binding GntR family transcriptional regulator
VGTLDRLTHLDRGESLAVRAYEAIRAAITTQQLVAGSHLSVPALAQRLNVSRTPVKEALARLEREGLVATRTNRGACVAFLCAADVHEIYHLREALEGLAARLAAERASPADIKVLKGLIEAQEQALKVRDMDAVMDVDMEFHRRLRELSGNRLANILRNLEDQVRTVLATSITIPGRREQATREHRTILASIERHNPDSAESAARDHIRNIRESVLRFIEAHRGAGLPLVARDQILSKAVTSHLPAAGLRHRSAARRGSGRARQRSRLAVTPEGSK